MTLFISCWFSAWKRRSKKKRSFRTQVFIPIFSFLLISCRFLRKICMKWELKWEWKRTLGSFWAFSSHFQENPESGVFVPQMILGNEKKKKKNKKKKNTLKTLKKKKRGKGTRDQRELNPSNVSFAGHGHNHSVDSSLGFIFYFLFFVFPFGFSFRFSFLFSFRFFLKTETKKERKNRN